MEKDAYRHLQDTTPITLDLDARVEMGVRCRDADHLPRGENAGKVLDIDGERVQIMHNGLRVVAGGYYGDFIQNLIERCQGVHEPQEEPVFNQVLGLVGPDSTMIELGAFWGFYSLWFMMGGPTTRRAILVEPDPVHISIGERNVALNKAWLGSGSVEIMQGFVGSGNGGMTPFQTENCGLLTMPHISVPSLMRQRNIDTLDILHCDTQGQELAVLEDCGALLSAGRIRFAFISTHTHHISGDPLMHERCLAYVRALGGRILVEHDVLESFSGDGLIVAYFGREPINWQPMALSYNRYSTSLFRNPLYDLAALRNELAAEREANKQLRLELEKLAVQNRT